MRLDASRTEQRASAVAVSTNVSLSKWVNERFPAWEQLLSAHDVARLTRRPRWVLLSLMVLGRFPRKHTFHGRGLGWLRNDVLGWMSKDLRVPNCHADRAPMLRRRFARQISLPLQCAGACSARRHRSAYLPCKAIRR